MSQPIRGHGGHFVFPIGPKTQTWKRTFRSYFLSIFVEFSSAIQEKSKMSQPIRGQGGHLVFPIGPKNINLVEDVEMLLPIKFRLIPFSGFRGEVKKCLSQSEARAVILFFGSAQKT